MTFEKLPSIVSDLKEELKALRKDVAELKAICMHQRPTRRKPIGYDEACKIIGKSKNTLYRYTSQGIVPHYKRGKRVFFYEEELIQWLDDGYHKTVQEQMNNSENNIIQLKPKRKF